MRYWTGIVTVTLSAGLLLLTGCQTTGDSSGPGMIQQQVHGDAPELEQAQVYRVGSSWELERMGIEELAALEVDFDRHELIVIALGERESAGYWAYVDQVSLNDTFEVRGRLNMPGEDDAAAQVISYPYTAVIINRVQRDDRPRATLLPVRGQTFPGTGTPLEVDEPEDDEQDEPDGTLVQDDAEN